MVNRESASEIKQLCHRSLEGAVRFLTKLMAFESVSGNEGPALRWLSKQFRPFVDMCELLPIPESLTRDPDFSFTDESRPLPRGSNLRMVLNGSGVGTVIFNTHVDVVPPCMPQSRIANGHLFGRGACDAKAQVAALWIMVRALNAIKPAAGKKIILHIVSEEETGGSGTLALVRKGEAADLCINLEPCSLRIMTSVRGAVWFVLETSGEAGHSGSTDPKSALKAATEAMGIIESYHDELLRKTRAEDALFAEMADPMPVTFGCLRAGDWPAKVPRSAVLSGVFGFLTTPKEVVMEELASRIRGGASPWLRAHHSLRFPYRHDASRVDPGLPAVRELSRAFRLVDLKGENGGMPASADAWFYTNLLGVPAVCTGCGELRHAHSQGERVRISDIADLAAALTIFAVEGSLAES